MSHPTFEVGQKIKVLVEAKQTDDFVLVSFDGSLFRVKNDSGIDFDEGANLDVVVVKNNPIEFKLFDSYKKTFDRFA
jgi:hypothetical protein